MQKGMRKELSASARSALAAAGLRVTRGKLVDGDGNDGSDDPIAQAILGYAHMFSKLGCFKTETDMRETIAAGLEDMRIEIVEMQRALAPSVAF